MPRKEFTPLDALKILAAPPSHPRDAGNPWHWPKIEQKLGFALPADYRSYIQAYGTGCFGRWLWVLNPFAKQPEWNLIEQSALTLDSRGRVSDLFAAESLDGPVTHRLWGLTEGGHRLYWRADSPNPSDWSVVVWTPNGPDGQPDHQLYPRTATEFLYEWLQTTLQVRLFPAERAYKPIFEIHPYRPA